MQTALLAAVALLACGIAAIPEGDLISSLPGWSGPTPSKMYSGYIDADEQGWMHTHYVFVESENNPATDPVVLWFNGGPGASSLFGFFVELGPFILSDASLQTKDYNETGVPTLFYNEYSWSKLANLLIVNSPPPVGFSYCDTLGPSGNGASCGPWNDTRTAVANHIFLKNWLNAFHEFKHNPLYVTGESYAGVYVPTLVREIVNDPKNWINIKGFAVGDACVGTEVLCGDHSGPYWDLVFMYGHGQFSTKLFNQVMNTCTMQELSGSPETLSDPCSDLLAQVQEEIGGYYEYNLYDDCWYENGLLQMRGYLPWPQRSHPLQQRNWWGARLYKPDPVSQLNDYPCGGSGAMRLYLNSTVVREAYHIPLNAYFFSGDDGAGFNYTLTEPDLRPFYVELAKNSSLRVLVYNGDADPGINSFISQNWTSNLGLEEITRWTPWTLDGKQRMGGYFTKYEGDFSFLTIRGSGHMVPEFKPAAAFEFLGRWLKNQEWQPYVNPTTPFHQQTQGPHHPRALSP